MKESIKILEEIIESTEKSINRLEDNDLSGTMRGVLELRKRQTQSLLNLINKYKEQEKMIELMIEHIKETDIYENYCIRSEDCEAVGGNRMCKDCILDYFRKKAKGE